MGVGKRVGDEIYLHVAAVDELSDADLRQSIQSALSLLDGDGRAAANVVKLNTRSRRVGLLSYPDFERDPFPSLAFSWVPARDAATGLASSEVNLSDSR